MDVKQQVDENLLDQKINEFILENLLASDFFPYTDFEFKYNKFDFYLKAKDLLRPTMCLIKDSYSFNTHVILHLNTQTLYYYSLKSKEEFVSYLYKQLMLNKEYIKFLNKRLEMNIVKISRMLSHLLRHAPQEYGVEMDSAGWVSVQEIVKATNITVETVTNIVESDEKGRYQLSDNGEFIRATQGHSVQVDLDEKVIKTFNGPVYHGTASLFLTKILEEGLQAGTRRHVHMTYDFDQANQTGKRHGSPVVIEVDVEQALADGVIFVESVNGYVLASAVPPKYLKVVT